LLASADEPSSRSIADQRGIDLILICPNGAEANFYRAGTEGPSLYERLLRGAPPSWLHTVDLPASIGGRARLYEVGRQDSISSSTQGGGQ
jgi:hypothetical protein